MKNLIKNNLNKCNYLFIRKTYYFLCTFIFKFRRLKGKPTLRRSRTLYHSNTAFLKLWSADHLWSSKKTEEKFFLINCVSHYSWKFQGLEMILDNRFSLFLLYWHFMKLNTLHMHWLPTVLSATKEGLKAQWMCCFSQSFPCTSGAAPV